MIDRVCASICASRRELCRSSHVQCMLTRVHEPAGPVPVELWVGVCMVFFVCLVLAGNKARFLENVSKSKHGDSCLASTASQVDGGVACSSVNRATMYRL